MTLTIKQLEEIPDEGVLKPDPSSFDLPEKILQFGTGVLLRGLPDYFVDNANRQGRFGGRIVVVKSTSGGDASAFERQNGLYTIAVRGIEHGHKVVENRISSAISRVLSATDHWSEILGLAAKEDIKIIISNTTEVGIQAVEEDIRTSPPASYPGKLLAFLYARYKGSKGSAEGGLVIIPTELISDNGKKLKAIILDLARYNRLEEAFIGWLESHNRFCSSLVDRIVPGKPDTAALAEIQKYLGYEDELLLICEAYRLWAIEGPEDLSEVLTFAPADHGVVITPNIEVYKELKLRLLNGTHTLCSGLAFLSGFDTVRDAMEDEEFSDFIKTLMLEEIAPSIPVNLPEGAARTFGLQVLDRFRNPYLEHRWISITLQYSSKMKLRVIPLLLKRDRDKAPVPEYMSKGFAAHILFMRPVKVEGGKYWGESRGIHYPINDDQAAVYDDCWKEPATDQSAGNRREALDDRREAAIGQVVRKVLSNEALWDTDLTRFEGFEAAVLTQLTQLMEKGGI
jgi:tagaturonate reductase